MNSWLCIALSGLEESVCARLLEDFLKGHELQNPYESRVDVPITNHLRDYVPNLEKYKVVQIFLMREDRNQEDYKV